MAVGCPQAQGAVCPLPSPSLERGHLCSHLCHRRTGGEGRQGELTARVPEAEGGSPCVCVCVRVSDSVCV